MKDMLLPVYPRLDIELVGAVGSTLECADGRRILDLYGGHAVMALGHGHPELVRALETSYRRLSFFSNSVRMPIQQQAAARVIGDSEHLAYVHFVNSGTEANEAALHLARRFTGRTKILSFDCSFHGRTLGSLQATGLGSYRQRVPLPLVAEHYGLIPFDDCSALSAIDERVAAVLCESVPSLAGIRMPSDGYYQALEERCRQVGALLIFDEVQGGMGRLGRWFAHQLFDVQPDIVSLAKSLGGGYPVGAMLCTGLLGGWARAGELGTTFGGGPVACHMVEAVCRVIQDEGLSKRATQIFSWIAEGVAARGLGDRVQLRGAGCLIGLETAIPAKELQQGLLRYDVLVGTSADSRTVRLLPSYLLAEAEVQRFLDALALVVNEA